MPLYSMTGFGSGEFEAWELALTVEIKTLNHRFCDLHIRLPRTLSATEIKVGELIRKHLKRGRVEVNFNSQTGSTKRLPHANLAVTKHYMDSLVAIGKHLDILKDNEKPNLGVLASFREIFQEEQPQLDLQKVWQEMKPGLEKALKEVLQMRQREGEQIKKDLLLALSGLENLLGDIRKVADGATEAYRQRLHQNIQETLESLRLPKEIDSTRLMQEVAYLADRSDIQEEINRLAGHLKQFAKDLGANQSPIGRRLDFLTQEMNREINTIGSKSNLSSLTSKVVDFKTELERIREQVQNVE